jgi:hypothetical protein
MATNSSTGSVGRSTIVVGGGVGGAVVVGAAVTSSRPVLLPESPHPAASEMATAATAVAMVARFTVAFRKCRPACRCGRAVIIARIEMRLPRDVGRRGDPDFGDEVTRRS